MWNICTISMTFTTAIPEFYSQKKKNTRGPKNTIVPRITAYFLCCWHTRIARWLDDRGIIERAGFTKDALIYVCQYIKSMPSWIVLSSSYGILHDVIWYTLVSISKACLFGLFSAQVRVSWTMSFVLFYGKPHYSPLCYFQETPHFWNTVARTIREKKG